MTQENGHAQAQKKAPPRTAPARPLVSIIVTARNYARYLGECLKSCVAQTVSARCEVIYSDDASDDESVSVARGFGEAVRVIAHPSHCGVVEARNRAVSASRGKVLIHVDGDDVLPNRFVADHLSVLTGETPFVYGPAQCFGTLNSFWEAPPWRARCLWEQNFVNTSAAIWRWAFDAAGGWRENPSGTFWDWDLFLRAARFGVPAASVATLLYRHHDANWSNTEGEMSWRDNDPIERHGKYLSADVRRHLARLSIGCIWSGRLPGLVDEWLEAIAANVASSTLKGGLPELVILDNSADQWPDLQEDLREAIVDRWAPFSSIRVLPFARKLKWSNEKERRDAVSGLLAEGYTRLLAETTGDVVWFIEDDVILPAGGLAALEAELAIGNPLRAAVAGAYQNRHTGKGYASGHFVNGAVSEILGELPDEPVSVDVTGTGCLLFWRDLAPQVVGSHFIGQPAHDWDFTGRMRQAGREVLLLPSVRCRHYQTETDWV